MDLAYSSLGKLLPLAACDNPDAPRFFFEVDKNFQTFSLFCKLGFRVCENEQWVKLAHL